MRKGSKKPLSDCLLVWMQGRLEESDKLDHGDEMCDQFWADYKLGGINEAIVKRVRNKKWVDKK